MSISKSSVTKLMKEFLIPAIKYYKSRHHCLPPLRFILKKMPVEISTEDKLLIISVIDEEMEKMMAPGERKGRGLRIIDFPKTQTIRIEGMDYSYEFFRALAFDEIGKIIRIKERKDHTVIIERIPDEAIKGNL